MTIRLVGLKAHSLVRLWPSIIQITHRNFKLTCVKQPDWRFRDSSPHLPRTWFTGLQLLLNRKRNHRPNPPFSRFTATNENRRIDRQTTNLHKAGRETVRG